MPGIHDTLTAAKRAHQGGDLARAEEGYRLVLEADPANAEAHYFLGAVRLARGAPVEAVALLRRASLLRPGNASTCTLLGVALAKQGEIAAAAAAFREALAADPAHAEAHYNLGRASQDLGQDDEAVASYREAVRLRPDSFEANDGLGRLLGKMQRPREALPYLEKALCLRPSTFEDHERIGCALAEAGEYAAAAVRFREAVRLQPGSADARRNLGTALHKLGMDEEAVTLLREAVRLRPDYVEAQNNLGIVLIKLARYEEAEAVLREAVRLGPGFAEAQNNLGAALIKLVKYEEAEAVLREAVRLRPDYAKAYNNLGSMEINRGRPEVAVGHFERGLAIQPDAPECHKDLAMALLLLGDFRRGFAEYEWRWKTADFRPPRWPQPRWDGAPLGGRTILLNAEQGLGDTLHFVRYAPLVGRRGGRVVVACQRPLLRIMESCPGIDQLIADDEAPPPFDVYASLMSLPGILGTTPEDIPAAVPYLRAEPALVASWRRALAALAPGGGLKVGIAWRGSPAHPTDRWRSFPLLSFAPVAAVPEVWLFSFQKGVGSEQLAAPDAPPAIDLGGQISDFAETAAALVNLDLVITADTSLAHLAGALGVEVWVALPYAPDWRWLLVREDTPWYPTMRLFRQASHGDWSGVFGRIAAAVRDRIQAAADRAGPIENGVGVAANLPCEPSSPVNRSSPDPADRRHEAP